MEWLAADSGDGLALWFQAWIEGFVYLAGALLLSILVILMVIGIVSAWCAETVKRRFWCRLAHRQVEVEFEKRGLWRQLAGVRSSTAFDGATSISCGRRCLDPDFRRQWEPALPLLVHRSVLSVVGGGDDSRLQRRH